MNNEPKPTDIQIHAHDGHTNGMHDMMGMVRQAINDEMDRPGAVKMYGLNKTVAILDEIAANLPPRPTPRP